MVCAFRVYLFNIIFDCRWVYMYVQYINMYVIQQQHPSCAYSSLNTIIVHGGTYLGSKHPFK